MWQVWKLEKDKEQQYIKHRIDTIFETQAQPTNIRTTTTATNTIIATMETTTRKKSLEN